MDITDILYAKKLSGGGGGGSAYDLVIVGVANDSSEHVWVASDLSVASGSIEACEQKILNHEPVNALMVLAYEHDGYLYQFQLLGIAFDHSYRELTFILSTGMHNYAPGTDFWVYYDSSFNIEALEIDAT